MKDAGYHISGIKCTTKFQCLKRTYKSVTDHNKKSGNNRRKWEYYEVLLIRSTINLYQFIYNF